MKFSIIIPVYNVEQYILKCLKSIEDQTYQNYEVIIVNDGSPDNSEEIIKKFIKNKSNFKFVKKENGGLSDARNYGLKYATGEYLLFIDSDDYIEPKLLERIKEKLDEKEYDLVRFETQCVDDKGKKIQTPSYQKSKNNKKETIVKSIVESEYVEPAWLYAYNKMFWSKFNFLYPKGRIHEDFGLTLNILSKSKSIGKINYQGYNYVLRENSIMNQVNYDKLKKRTNDFYEEYLVNVKNIDNKCKANRLLLNYCTSAMIYKTRELKEEERKELLKKLKNNHFLKNYYVLDIKTFLIKIRYWLCLNQLSKKLSEEYWKEFEV